MHTIDKIHAASTPAQVSEIVTHALANFSMNPKSERRIQTAAKIKNESFIALAPAKKRVSRKPAASGDKKMTTAEKKIATPKKPATTRRKAASGAVKEELVAA